MLPNTTVKLGGVCPVCGQVLPSERAQATFLDTGGDVMVLHSLAEAPAVFTAADGTTIWAAGGSGNSGVYNAITPSSLIPAVGYTPILGGTSYVQSVTFTHKGPEARALVTYSQSSDPANPHYADMTALFSNYGWVNLPFAEGDIRRDPNLKVLKLKEKR